VGAPTILAPWLANCSLDSKFKGVPLALQSAGSSIRFCNVLIRAI
jgi:hypothetical protein